MKRKPLGSWSFGLNCWNFVKRLSKQRRKTSKKTLIANLVRKTIDVCLSSSILTMSSSLSRLEPRSFQRSRAGILHPVDNVNREIDPFIVVDGFSPWAAPTSVTCGAVLPAQFSDHCFDRSYWPDTTFASWVATTKTRG
jgi:hypothetical protein